MMPMDLILPPPPPWKHACILLRSPAQILCLFLCSALLCTWGTCARRRIDDDEEGVGFEMRVHRAEQGSTELTAGQTSRAAH
ncbi:hypothetical protein GUJ93_ZPchr0004g38606 [Zizania palustris]|uniref:Uncharacterized protein n=1 Tax=Zizania palustris TaxID=103762 RepID=A0A8J5VYP5_ZIZPA|nr:hypothetical protein GUJ93_ZPchr0004g38744 [Zizania palustris]KAG8064791.1 hypothetical protein GUJ93_ZPchr0004g38606 [Zizania palustris]